jgi:hypothetical protein
MPNNPRKSKPDGASTSFATAITKAWRKSTEAVIETGGLLLEAKGNLAHGDFQMMVQRELPFSARTAQRLMAIAAHPVLSNATHVSLLPPCWGTLYALTEVADATLEAALADGRLHAGLARNDIRTEILRLPPSGVKHPAPKIADIMRKALSLVATADLPETSPATAAANKNEAITALRCAIAVLACKGLDANDLVVTTKGAAKTKSCSRRAA